jgi:hypothetical protein
VDHPNPSPDDSGDPAWTLPLHGAEVPGDGSAPLDLPIDAYLNLDDEVPAVDFQPRLTRFGEAA